MKSIGLLQQHKILMLSNKVIFTDPRYCSLYFTAESTLFFSEGLPSNLKSSTKALNECTHLNRGWLTAYYILGPMMLTESVIYVYEHASIPGFLAFFARMEIEIQLNRFVASTFLSICITAYGTATLRFANTSINCANLLSLVR